MLVKTHFTRRLGENSAEVKLNQVENWLSKQLTYSLHKLVYQIFRTHSMVVHAIDELWQLYLIVYQN